MEEDWEDINSSISDDIEWIDEESPVLPSSPFPNVVATAVLSQEVIRRLRDAETRASVAEHRVVQLTQQVAELEIVVQRQQEDNNHLLSILESGGDERPKKRIQLRTRRCEQPSKAHTNRAPQSVKLPKQNYWAKNNHRSSHVASARKI